MKSILVFIFLLAISPSDIGKIAKVNKLKDEAEKAYLEGNYQVAIQKYSKLFKDYKVEDDNAILNMSHAQYHLKQKDLAVENYKKLISSNNDIIKSIAANQLGVIAHNDQKIDEALLYFKRALKANSANEEARFNYEMLKKIKEKQKSDDKSQENKDKQQKEPSEYAKQLKRQAEALAAQRRYSDAHNLMVEGLSKDPTVESFSDFIGRLKDVVEINK